MYSRERIVVSTSRCGRDNPGSNPGHGMLSYFFIAMKNAVKNALQTIKTNIQTHLRILPDKCVWCRFTLDQMMMLNHHN